MNFDDDIFGDGGAGHGAADAGHDYNALRDDWKDWFPVADAGDPDAAADEAVARAKKQARRQAQQTKSSSEEDDSSSMGPVSRFCLFLLVVYFGYLLFGSVAFIVGGGVVVLYILRAIFRHRRKSRSS